MASNEFRAAKKKIRRAQHASQVKAAVDELDAIWRSDRKVMRDRDWVRLSALVGAKVRKLKGKDK